MIIKETNLKVFLSTVGVSVAKSDHSCKNFLRFVSDLPVYEQTQTLSTF